MLSRRVFDADHETFRNAVRRFVMAEVVPHHEAWEEQGQVSRELWRAAGRAGLLCCNVPERYGGPGADILYNIIVTEELARAGMTGPGFAVHTDMVASYILAFGTEAQRLRWLPKMVAGELIGAIAMTEPDTGSDLRSIRTRARLKGDHYCLSGQKLYISNGQLADLVIVACKTGESAISLVIVEADSSGFRRGRRLKKIGLRAQDTSELFFDEVRVPCENRLGDEGAGFTMLTHNLGLERLVQAARSVSAAEASLEWTVAYTSERNAFGKPIASFQNTQFKLAELSAQIVAGRTLVDACLSQQLRGELDPADAARAKLFCTEVHCRTVDECLQLHGGFGYMLESPIARAYVDARVTRIVGGSSEILKTIVARDLLRR